MGRSLGFSHCGYICLITMYYSQDTDQAMCDFSPSPHRLTHAHTHTHTWPPLIHLMDQPVSAFAGLIFHLREGKSTANRSITERKREIGIVMRGGKNREGRGYGCRRTAAAAERHDVMEEWNDRHTHTNAHARSSEARQAKVDRSKGKDWARRTRQHTDQRQTHLLLCILMLHGVSVALCSFLIGQHFLFLFMHYLM